MSKKWILLACVLSLGSYGTSQAHPLDSPDIVYIDGLPCNRFCQDYMAWSRSASSPAETISAQPEQHTSAEPARRSAASLARRKTIVRAAKSARATPVFAARQIIPAAREMPRARTTAVQVPDRTSAGPDTTVTTGVGRVAELQPATEATAAPKPRSLQEQVSAALDVAERTTVATAVQAPLPKASESDADRLVAVVMTRPGIRSVSDLAHKDVAIDDGQSAYESSVRTAIVAAGAPEVQLSGNQAKALDRLINEEVPAAVLALVSPDAAEGFPDIPGFKIFRIPLSPGVQ